MQWKRRASLGASFSLQPNVPLLTYLPKQYYNRWANYEQSAKRALDLYAKTEKKMEEMQITSDRGSIYEKSDGGSW